MRNIFLLLLFIVTTAFSDDFSIPSRDPFSATLNNSTIATNTPLHSSWIPLYFAKAKSVAHFLSKPDMQVLSPLGKIEADTHNNQLFIRDDPAHIAAARLLIQHLDKTQPQFLIKAKIINLDQQYEQTLGILFQTTATPHNITSPLIMNEPTTTVGQFSMNMAKLSANNLLDLQISALEQEGHATLISNPALVTLNHLPATIQSGAEIPYQEATTSGATSTTFKKAALRLEVTPQLIGHHHILLHIALNEDKVSDLTVNGVPAIQTQQLTTQVIVKDKQTLVLGGILETSNAKQNTGIPVVNDLPIIGHLLRHHSKRTTQRNLLIFITPSVMMS
jgi:type IV pilus assembly protein PilQ